MKSKQMMHKDTKATVKPHNISDQREERRKAHIETNGEGRVCGEGGRKTEDVPH